MLFNGKYYNKPGHLGMTRAKLKEALKKSENDVQPDLNKPLLDISLADIASLIGGNTLTYENIPMADYFDGNAMLVNPDRNMVPRSIVTKLATGVDTYVYGNVPLTSTGSVMAYSSIINMSGTLYFVEVIAYSFTPVSNVWTFKVSATAV